MFGFSKLKPLWHVGAVGAAGAAGATLTAGAGLGSLCSLPMSAGPLRQHPWFLAWRWPRHPIYNTREVAAER